MNPSEAPTAGRRVDDHVSFIDFAATFLGLAGLTAGQAGMEPVEGRSLAGIFSRGAAAGPDPARGELLFGQERHDVGRPDDVGYPVRGIFAEGCLYARNFAPGRWPGRERRKRRTTRPWARSASSRCERKPPFLPQGWRIGWGTASPCWSFWRSRARRARFRDGRGSWRQSGGLEGPRIF